ncbi:hypothetical protein [Winogradskyella wichelsiae]|uniref:hypothetical protein n=1 Tax=Winogradskyella wichelsiae TaxID=2697007 RepID=UPI003EF1E71D
MPLTEIAPKQKDKISKKLFQFNFHLKQNDQIGLIFFIAFIISTSLIWYFDQRFDSETWKTQPLSRYEMVDDILYKDLFLDNTKEEITDKLGGPDEYHTKNKDAFIYYLGHEPRFSNQELMEFILIFKDGKVIKMDMQPRLQK